MDESTRAMTEGRNLLVHIEEHLRRRLTGRASHVQLTIHGDGLVLRGRTRTYYAKQLAQQAVMEVSELPIRANDIEVTPPRK